ncbi:hypothetical protein [Novosphingobium jiangmenense]|jgi:PBP1b-binding outer membrane lipoprotein LpoB|uniref:Uncharacterized protein n=1 Tax=Novosphingobium jiangmenense TaxID=2791981 RepID=A0ABS0HG74_9SPHN|nr:hypothetical protein [Novosphingobium jiangmenense]MBF9151260.1 hypothetical protein [Novosphingobium jiangmenense]
MRKLILAAVAGTAFALAGCSEKPAAEATEAAATEAATDVAADASAPAADASAEASEAASM